jgi:hypothetical protein
VYPKAQPREETASRSSGVAICGRNALYSIIDTEIDALATISRNAPSR